MSMSKTRTAIALAMMAAGSGTPALAQQLNTRPELDLILGDTVQLEDFEGVSLHAGGTIVVANPLNSTTAPQLGIQAGVTYSSPIGLSIHAGFSGGEENNVLQATDRLDIVFDEPQRGVGFHLSVGGAAHTVTFSDDAGVIGELEFSSGAGGGFIGWQDWLFGVTSVQVTRAAGGVIAIDDVAWGRAVPTCPADFAPPEGALDFSDVVAYLVAFSDTEDNADMAPPFGVWDFSDIVQFLSSFAAGCQ